MDIVEIRHDVRQLWSVWRQHRVLIGKNQADIPSQIVDTRDIVSYVFLDYLIIARRKRLSEIYVYMKYTQYIFIFYF